VPVDKPTHGSFRLLQKLPTATIDLDTVTNTPKFVRNQGGFLTDAATGRDAKATVAAFIDENRDLYGFDSGVLAAAEKSRESANATGMMENLVWSQQLDGIPVYGAQILANVTKNSELV